MHARTRRFTAALAAALVAAVTVAGCGGDDHSYANKPRPPASIVIEASISNKEVSVSPVRFGAGPIELLVTNQTGAPQRVTLESDDGAGSGAGLKQETPPINPRDTARLSADVTPGGYRVHVDGTEIRAARLVVGRERPSAQGDLLQP